MSSKDSRSDDREAGAATASDIKSSESLQESDGMKRAAAKQLIERYYYQLTDGCGSTECTNKFCTSSGNFYREDLPRNEAAVEAIRLMREYGFAKLCDTKPSKKAKSEDEDDKQDQTAPSKEVARDIDKGATPSTSGLGSQASNTSVKKPLPVPAKVETPYLTEEKLLTVIESCRAVDDYSLLIRTIGQVFNNSDSLVMSFRKQINHSKEELRAMEVDQDKDTDDAADGISKEHCESAQEESQSGSTEGACVDRTVGAEGMPGTSKEDIVAKSSQVLPAQKNEKDDEITIDLESMRRAFTALFDIPGHPFLPALINALIYLSGNVELELKYHRADVRDPNYLNLFLIVLEIPGLHSPEFIDKAFPQFCKALGQLPVAAQGRLVRMFSKYPKEKLKSFIDMLQQLVTVNVISNEGVPNRIVNDDDGVTGATRVMKIIYFASLLAGRLDPQNVLQREKDLREAADESMQEFFQGAVSMEPKEKTPPKEDALAKELGINPMDCRKPVIPFEDFINEPLNEQIEMDKDYPNYYKSENDKFSFMNHQFILTPATKSLGLFFDNRIRMLSERRTSVLQSLVRGAPMTPYLRLRIRRDHIIDDSLVGLEMAAMDNPQDLKKQLYVEFDGEQGIDEGGVSKEFFQMIVEEIFNPDFGMFIHDEDTRKFWFNPTSFENDSQFTLIGIVLGLAIYNNVILDVHFPMVVYRKLMGKLGTFEDLFDSHPTLSKNLKYLLEYEGDVQDTFLYDFHISYTDVFGTTLTYNLKENGEDTPVTNENRKEFVDLYADFLLNKSVEKQFRAFKRGFQMVTDESPMHILFRPEEVELLVCGSKHLDFCALEEATEYDSGFSTESSTVRNFWEIVHAFSDEQKRLLLQFTTGSDRVPVGGLSKLKLIIARNGPDSDRLPTAHTCFNVLLLPDYSNKDKLEERLLKAITHAKGFGML